MAECYHPDVVFSDPAFGQLNGREVWAMWKMLIGRNGGNLEITFSDVEADDHLGAANWTAKYVFGKTGRHVTNRVHAEFKFKDGLIVAHRDSFNFAKWARQAFGLKGFLFGNADFFRSKIRVKARQSLQDYIQRFKL